MDRSKKQRELARLTAASLAGLLANPERAGTPEEYAADAVRQAQVTLLVLGNAQKQLEGGPATVSATKNNENLHKPKT